MYVRHDEASLTPRDLSDAWAGPESEVGLTVTTVREQTLGAYRAAPKLVDEHANIEQRAVEGGYGRRQLYELIQNGADELLGASGRIEVVLTPNALYCANQGNPLSVEGVGALLFSNLSAKTGPEIGRFGLGFKSVLGITTTPEIFSRSGSVRFDPRVARTDIERALGHPVDRTPTLRIAIALEPEPERTSDAILDELMGWATTIVRLKRDVEDSSWLEPQLPEFPAEFLLFSPHVRELTLRDCDSGYARSISASHDGSLIRLREGHDDSVWRVFSTIHRPGDRARRDGGTIAARDELPIAWAVDIENRQRRRGTFWAFFPTYERTTLSGVLNAPWKLNEDRTRLIEKSPFNEELIHAACEMILEHLPELVPTEDPGLVLELMPARGSRASELAGWADDVVTAKINQDAAYVPSVPDQNGELELPAAISLHPREVPRDVLDLWSASPSRPADWAHPSVETRERRSRVEIYMKPSGKSASPTKTWLEVLATKGEPETSVAAVTVAAALLTTSSGFQSDIRKAAIVMNEQGELVSPDPRNIFVRAPLPIDMPVQFVHQDLVAAKRARSAVEALGIREVDVYAVLESYVAHRNKAWSHDNWETFWELVRKVRDPERVTLLLSRTDWNASTLEVRTRAGTYAPLSSTLLPGDIVSERSPDAAACVIDVSFHSDHLAVLRHFGAAPSPATNGGRTDEPWFNDYEQRVRNEYLVSQRSAALAASKNLLAFRKRPFAGPAAPLSLELGKESRVRLTHALLQASPDLDPWTFSHLRESKYPELRADHPIAWLVKRRGLLSTSLGISRVNFAVGPGLTAFDAVLPVVRGVAVAAAKAIGLPDSVTDFDEARWQVLLKRTLQLEDERALAHAYLAAATAQVAAPSMIRCRVGLGFDNRARATVAVTSDAEVARVLTNAGDPHIVVQHATDADVLVQNWGLRSDRDAVRSEIGFTPVGEEDLLIDLFPMLRYRLDEEQQTVSVIRCSELRIDAFTDSGRTSTPRMIVVEGTRVYRHTDLADSDFLRDVSARFGLDLGDAKVAAILGNVEYHKTLQLREAIREAEDNKSRLLLAIGGRELRRRIPLPLLEAAARINERELSDDDIAELALAVHGVEVLKSYADVLERQGLNPPGQWAGRRSGVEFVTDLGFSPAYAGFEKRTPPATLEIEGRPDIPRLHDFQKLVVADTRRMLRGDGDATRGLISLPTGAGKTRVTVEALVNAMTDGELNSCVLWIAQTEELCEQAVQTWSEIWRGLGPRRRLTLSRLWGGYEATKVEYGEQVVVATIQKLDAGVFVKASYEWLRQDTAVIVIDEAHSSIGDSYDRLLSWHAEVDDAERVPLIGLTATPFRNTNVEETQALAKRYGYNRLEARALAGETAYSQLQDLGILSRVDHEALPGQEMDLTEPELAQLRRFRRLPDRATGRLGESVGRNSTLLDHISALDPSWPVLLFAASVEHAQIMAALLTRQGIPAAAIAGETDRGARRHYIREFRDGNIRVLTNFNVLTAGFDAPKVRALYIARPTYSVNMYQQMVGRGLRGPQNGGTDRCLLVNVEDNVAQFGEKLAFHDFEYLWNPSGNGNRGT
jgi:superfamily II DNA or RNA helicase